MTDYRKDFPLLSEIGENTVDGREWIYIDNAATSQRPQCVIDAERDFYLKHNANPLRGNYPLSVEATEPVSYTHLTLPTNREECGSNRTV